MTDTSSTDVIEPEPTDDRSTTPEPTDDRSTTPEPTDDRSTTPEPTDDRSTTPEARSLPDGSSVPTFLAWFALVVCSLLALYALVQFYASTSAAIELWIQPQYEPLAQAAFNLVVLLCALVGVSLLVRELS